MGCTLLVTIAKRDTIGVSSVAFLEFIPPLWSTLLNTFWGPGLVVIYFLSLVALAYWWRNPHHL
jgi:fucose 4-O-acetylase-like acetyltransferase